MTVPAPATPKETAPPEPSASARDLPTGGRALGYASIPKDAALDGPQLASQCEAISRACAERGLELVEIISERESGNRSGLTSLLGRLDDDEASCVVVASLVRLSRNVAELAPVVDRLERSDVRLIAADVGLDTASVSGRALVARRQGDWVRPTAELPPPAERPTAERPPVVERPPEPEPRPAPADSGPVPPTAVPAAPAARGLRVLGYASAAADSSQATAELDEQREAIERACAQLGGEIVEVVRDLEPKAGKALDRPGLSYLMGRVAAGSASCIVVAALERMSRSVAELGPLLHWLEHNEIRLIALDLKLDTSTRGGRTTARALASVGGWEHHRLSERTRNGLAAARAKRRASGAASSTDFAALRERIAAMRVDGMTLQAIADLLNEEGVPTQRGGAKWRPSSVQTAAGYKRKSRAREIDDLPAVRQAAGRRAPGARKQRPQGD